MTTSAALLEKLDAAELRIGLCEDTKLAKLLEPALPNILGFLSSPEPTVKSKVMAILGHINKRVKGDPSIALPLSGLSKLFLSTTNAMVANFALVYVEMAFGRAPATERAALLPQLLVGAAARPTAQQDTLLQLLLLALPTLPLPTAKDELQGPKAKLPFLEVAVRPRLSEKAGDGRPGSRRLPWAVALSSTRRASTRTRPRVRPRSLSAFCLASPRHRPRRHPRPLLPHRRRLRPLALQADRALALRHLLDVRRRP